MALTNQLMTGWWFGCHQFYFPINIGNLIIPIDELIFFQRGGPGPPTSYGWPSQGLCGHVVCMFSVNHYWVLLVLVWPLWNIGHKFTFFIVFRCVFMFKHSNGMIPDDAGDQLAFRKLTDDVVSQNNVGCWLVDTIPQLNNEKNYCLEVIQ